MRKIMHLTLSLFGVIHKGTLLSKIISITILSIVFSPITYLVDKLYTWHLCNEDYTAFVLGAIIIDHLIGMAYHAFWKRDFSLKKMATGFILKLLIIVSAGYLFEGLNTLMVQQSILKEYTIMVLRLMIFLYPAGSAFGNMYEMTGRKFPPVGFMDKLKKFSESATINK